MLSSSLSINNDDVVFTPFVALDVIVIFMSTPDKVEIIGKS